MKDEKTKRKNREGGRAGAVVDGGLLRRSLQLRRRAKKREQGRFGERAENEWREEKEMKKKNERGGVCRRVFVRREGKGMFG